MTSRINNTFEKVLAKVKSNIIDSGFLLIHEINTQEILKRHGYDIADLRQLMFFHPRYMKIIIEKDISCVINVPLKIVVRDLGDDKTEVTHVEACKLFAESPLLNGLAFTLDEKFGEILNNL